MYSELSEDQQHYYGVISALDKQVGRLRKKLKNLGISENTLIFYSSDNGPETSLEVRNENIPFARAQGLTNGLRGRKRSLYEGGIRVPGIVEWPSKIQPGTQVNVPCFTSDYFPTIASVIGIDLQEYQRPYDGEDIMKYLKQKKLKRIKPLTFKYKKQFAVIDNDFKLYGVSGETLQLYNLKKDFGEKKDISKINPNKLNALNVIYKDWNLSVEKSNTGSDY
jgi:arylsulfatase A-like enzyme